MKKIVFSALLVCAALIAQAQTSTLNVHAANGTDIVTYKLSEIESISFVELSDFSGGDGTEASPYQIANARQMNNMHSAVKSGETVYFEMIADVDLSGINWVPLNFADPYMNKVVFNGNGHTISNLTSEQPTYASFFGVLHGECRNVRFVNANIIGTGNSCGIIGGYIGTANKPGLVEQVYVSGTVKTANGSPIGGIGGNIRDGKIINCYADVQIERTTNQFQKGAGAIVGLLMNNAVIENCYSLGTINAPKDDNVGGIAGRGNNDSNWTVNNCIAWTTKLTGVWSSNRALGRVWTTNNTVGKLFARKDMVLDLYRDGQPGGTPYYGTGDNTTFAGDDAENIITAAKTLGWDETVWDLSGEMPRFKWELNK